MTETDVYTEIVLAELAHLVAHSGGDPAGLDAALGTTSYFGRRDVLTLGAQLQQARTGGDGTPVNPAVVSYFDAVGRVLTAGPTVIAVHEGPGRSVVYFETPDCHVEVALVDGRAFLVLRPGAARIDTTGRRVVAVHRPGESRRHLAVTEHAAAASDDGHRWTAVDITDTTPAAALRDFLGR